jgi:two-component system cell cycle sensor histidine kinase/response regulator CckA
MTARKSKPAVCRQSILAVDDDPLVLEFMQTVLGRRGYKVIAAPGGLEALEEFRRIDGAVDLLVSDVAMPAMDGPALAREITKAKPGLPVLFVSGYVQSAKELQRAANRSHLEILPKPFSPDVLVRSVERLLLQ